MDLKLTVMNGNLADKQTLKQTIKAVDNLAGKVKILHVAHNKDNTVTDPKSEANDLQKMLNDAGLDLKVNIPAS